MNNDFQYLINIHIYAGRGIWIEYKAFFECSNIQLIV